MNREEAKELLLDLVNAKTPSGVPLLPVEAREAVQILVEEQEFPEGLEEAAEKYNEMMSWAWEAPNYPHKAAFIAGAK